MSISLLLKFSQEVLMGKADYFESFKQNADGFICSILPGISHPQVQYSPGMHSSLLVRMFGERAYLLTSAPLRLKKFSRCSLIDF